MHPNRFNAIPSKSLEHDGAAHLVKARFRTFEIPVVHDAVIVGKDSSAEWETLLATLRMVTPEALVGWRLNDDIIGAIVVREGLLKKLPDGLLEKFVRQNVRPYMSRSEILHLELDLEIILEASV